MNYWTSTLAASILRMLTARERMALAVDWGTSSGVVPSYLFADVGPFHVKLTAQ